MEKSTHVGYRIDLFMPIIKNTEGNYIAVLSDDSTDRDDESLSKGCIEKFGENDKDYLAALLNHDNDIMNLVAEWVNRKVVNVGSNVVYVAEPKFYMSNPKAKIIRGMLDEGAKPGVSIGAIVKDFEMVDGKKVFTELELLEASFVGIPSNRHGRAMAVAKSYNHMKEVQKMDEKFTQKDIDSAVEKANGKLVKSHEAELEKKDADVAKLTKDLEKVEALKKDAEDAAAEDKADAEAKEEESEKKLSAAKAEKKAAEELVEKTVKKVLEKQKFADQGGSPDESVEDIDKACKEGKLPVMYGI